MISDAMEKSLFKQLNDEFYSSYLYLAMSAYCNHLDFNGAELAETAVRGRTGSRHPHL